MNSSDDDDDDRTAFVRPPQTNPPSTPAPRVAVDADDDIDDKTVIMKPSLRAREAAAALDEERTRQPDDIAAGAARPGHVDFDVTQEGGIPTVTPTPSRTPWVIGFVLVAGLAAVVAVMLI